MKIRHLYIVSFCFGIFYLISKILLIPGWVMLFREYGVNFKDFLYVLSTNSLSANIYYFGGFIGGVIAGILVIVISLLLLRKKINENKMMNAGTIIVSIVALIEIVILIICIIKIILTPSVQTLIDFGQQIALVRNLILPLLFLVSIVLLTFGYIKDRLRTHSFKDSKIIFSFIAILIITAVHLVIIF